MTARTLIQAEELALRLDDARIRIVDCRYDLARPAYGRERYDEEHLPGAVHADMNRDLAAPVTAVSGRHPLPAPGDLEARLRAWGIDDDSMVVAYDDGNAAYAARLWWLLRWLGHDEVVVLEGGMRRWQQLGLPLEEDVRARPPGSFVARPRAGYAVETDEVLAVLGDPSVRILDARAPERYRGEVEPIDPVAGHVPGAASHPFATSIDSNNRFRPPAELRAAFLASLGGVPPGRAIAMCGSGVTACHLLLALEHAGLPGARLYAGSWSEWCRDPSRPVRRGAEP